MNRRLFLQRFSAASALATASISRQQLRPVLAASDRANEVHLDGVALPDDGWNLWIDEHASWENDEIYLPDSFDLTTLPVNPPSGGWEVLDAAVDGANAAVVQLPCTVEQHFWKRFSARPYTPDEYRYAADDPIPENGAYRGVSWWWRNIYIPESWEGQRILLQVRGARMRAEVYLNERLVGYSILEELPFECDLTSAARPGGKNRLTIRITNPGGRYDWVDGGTIRWGQVNLYRSHGFGGLDREMILRCVPLAGHIGDSWVLNTPEARTIHAFLSVEGTMTEAPLFEVVDPASGQVLDSRRGEAQKTTGAKQAQTVRATMNCPEARLWDLPSPVLYHLRATLTTIDGHKDVRTVPFGFRWFSPEGLGADALFRLNGRRIKLYSSISWGFWGFNGLWPTPELAVREVTQAKKLGLNCLNFHRNVGKEDVFRAHDKLGLLRYMEPGGGKLSIGKTPAGAKINAPDLVMEPATDAASRFSRQFMLAKCKAMVRTFRSHPSLIQYTLQNEIGADLKNPDTLAVLRLMHQEDPSRSVVLNDGFVARSAAQAWLEPYSDKVHRSDEEPWGDWWINHQGAGDQWYDEFYQDSEHFTYRQPLKTALVEFGEMEGCAVPDNHPLMIHQIESRQFGGNGKSYDLEDHRQIVVSYEEFLDRWGFRKAFPSAERLYSALGDKSYESWQQYMENVRICDEVDFAAISGWESTAIENHSGIVDNLRNFKGNPELIASSLRPIRPVAKQHKLCYSLGEQAVFDLYLLNDSSQPVSGNLRFSMIEPRGNPIELGSWTVPPHLPDQFSYTIQTGFTTPNLSCEGIYQFRFSCDADSRSDFTREIWVINSQPGFSRKLSIGVSGVLGAVRRQLSLLNGVEISEFSSRQHFDLIVTSGVVKGSKLDQAIGDETGSEAQPVKGAPSEPQVAGLIAEEVLSAVHAGTPLLAIVPNDHLADGVAKQLAALGAFTYKGQVGDLRAPWMGNWLFVRDHATFSSLPVNRVLGVHYQALGKASNGLLVERAAGAADPEVIMGYSRDHDRKIGAASFVCKLGSARLLVHRAPEFNAPLQQRWLANSIAFLTQPGN
ncbi:MAG: sugar-binding domain-containing protein [Terracidiphilus sp.]